MSDEELRLRLDNVSRDYSAAVKEVMVKMVTVGRLRTELEGLVDEAKSRGIINIEDSAP
jgi:type III secretory pathway component EscV